MSFPYNPFEGGGGTKGSSLPPGWSVGFYDLSAALNRALDENDAPVLVTGARQTGKSTLTDRLKQRTDIRVVSVDLRDLSREAIVGDVPADDAIAESVASELYLDDLTTDYQNVTVARLLGEILPAIVSDRPIVILVDELDVLDAHSAQQKFIDAIVETYRAGPPTVRWIIIRGEMWGRVSAPLTGMREIRTRSMRRQEIAELLALHLEQGLYPFEPETATMLWEATGGYPMFVQAVLRLVFEERKRLFWDGEADWQGWVGIAEVQAAMDKVVQRPQETISHALMFVVPATARLMHVLLAGGLIAPVTKVALRARFIDAFPRWESSFDHALDALCRVGLGCECTSGYRFAVPLLARILNSDRYHGILAEEGYYPNSRACHYARLGDDSLRQGNVDEAIARYRVALAADPVAANAHSLLLIALLKNPTAARVAEAKEQFAWLRSDSCTLDTRSHEKRFDAWQRLINVAEGMLSSE